ncbi:kinase-like protein [Pluteus cervinus]|uniref:Kinase-like protein n=1 Tax=Pluteus cervinus TaxID=181527 RepID=A0ACD3A1P5_9AGAR|nr:kinase-like protein [Pluteus cervinus]
MSFDVAARWNYNITNLIISFTIARTSEIDALRFQDKDLDLVGTLEYGQFGLIEVVICRMNGISYVRKSIQKVFAMRTREQCSPQYERDLLLLARKSNTKWAPQLLCAFQTPTHLSLIMDYAEGGTLWDVLESSPDERIKAQNMRWWTPQIVSAVHWCHTQGFVHRDIKPHNFVLTPTAHVLLIDFGSAAPLLPPSPDGSQRIPKRHCLVPCGTCDYISPEILKAHEEALVALEFEDDEDNSRAKQKEDEKDEGYGLETDWWSLGVMLYEMAYGVAPFFTKDIRQTYLKIMDHEKCLRFNRSIDVGSEYQNLLQCLLQRAEIRLGRQNVMEITDHPYFEGTLWGTLHTQEPPDGIHLPQFVYQQQPPSTTNGQTTTANSSSPRPGEDKEEYSQGFAFSAFFQSSGFRASTNTDAPNNQSQLSEPQTSTPPSNRPHPNSAAVASSLISSLTSSRLGAVLNQDSNVASAAFLGFSWGPSMDAFPDEVEQNQPQGDHLDVPTQVDNDQRYPIASLSRGLTPNFKVGDVSNLMATPRPQMRHPSLITPKPLLTPAPGTFSRNTPAPKGLEGLFPFVPDTSGTPQSQPRYPFITPNRPSSATASHHPFFSNGDYEDQFDFNPITNTLPRTSTVRRTIPRRLVSDREAMKQLVDCVGMSARKKVMESGRKPKVLDGYQAGGAGAKRRSSLSKSRSRSGSGSGVEKLGLGPPPPLPALSMGVSTSSSSLLSASGGPVRRTSSGSVLGSTPAGGQQQQKPIPPSALRSSSRSRSNSLTGTVKKELRFLPSLIPVPDYASSSQAKISPLLISSGTPSVSYVSSMSSSTTSILNVGGYGTEGPDVDVVQGDEGDAPTETETDDSSSAPPSPSPRPGSALSTSRRSATPTLTATFSGRLSAVRFGFNLGSTGSMSLSAATFVLIFISNYK